MITAADRIQQAWDTRPLWTQAEVLTRLPRWMVRDFDCPSGAHEWLDIETCGVWLPAELYQFCKHCKARRHKEVAA